MLIDSSHEYSSHSRKIHVELQEIERSLWIPIFLTAQARMNLDKQTEVRNDGTYKEKETRWKARILLKSVRDALSHAKDKRIIVGDIITAHLRKWKWERDSKKPLLRPLSFTKNFNEWWSFQKPAIILSMQKKDGREDRPVWWEGKCLLI